MMGSTDLPEIITMPDKEESLSILLTWAVVLLFRYDREIKNRGLDGFPNIDKFAKLLSSSDIGLETYSHYNTWELVSLDRPYIKQFIELDVLFGEIGMSDVLQLESLTSQILSHLSNLSSGLAHG